MKVLIDLTQIPIKKAGVGMYALALINEISLVESSNEYYVAVLSDDIDILKILNSNTSKFKIILIHSFFRNFFFRFLLEQIYLPYIILKNTIDVIHSLHYSFPLLPLRVKKVVTLHDMTFFLFPKLHKKFKTYYFRLMIKASIYYCDKIICVSKSTLSDVQKHFKKNLNDKLIAIPLGTSYDLNSYRYPSDVAIIKTLNLISKKYLLFIGTLEPRKNIESIIYAYSKLSIEQRNEFDLVIVGQKGWYFEGIYNIVQELNLANKVKFTGFVSEEVKRQLLFNSYIFIYPSLYEGFGLPVLEAMSYGIPTITSNISSMPEVAGNAAILIDPANVLEIFEAILLLIEDKIAYNNFSCKSIAQAKYFTWGKMVSSTVELYV